MTDWIDDLTESDGYIEARASTIRALHDASCPIEVRWHRALNRVRKLHPYSIQVWSLYDEVMAAYEQLRKEESK